MTSRQMQQTPAIRPEDRFPDFPPRDDMQNSLHLDDPGHQATLRRHFGSGDTVIVLSEIPVRWTPGQREGHRIPDLLVAFDVDRPLAIEQNGYSIGDQGKPPDLVLEIASQSTGEEDYTAKRIDYAAFGIPEYWRFDPSGGQHHDAPLAGDRLVDGTYQPIEINQAGQGRLWGHSDILNLDFCWEEGRLRWWDPAAERYLETHDEEADARIAAEAQSEAEREARIAAEAQSEAEREARIAAEAQSEAEQEARTAAEARVRELEAELERHRQS